jgi:hypothetical protein
MTFAEKVLGFYRELNLGDVLPEGVEILNPYQDPTAFGVCKSFYGKFYNDDLKRFLILGINPGRYGAGITGIPFTDPIKLEKIFGIPNGFHKKAELSADFIHAMIAAFGGPEKFFSKFFISSVSPLGFVQEGKNLNYYDTPILTTAVEPFIRSSMQRLCGLNIDRSVVFCLGEGANHKYLQKLNEKEKFFDRIIALAHPRFIMQYRRKRLNDYLDDYLQKLNSVL